MDRTNTERVARQRERYKAMDLVELKVWTTPEHAKQIKADAQIVRDNVKLAATQNKEEHF